MYKICMPINTSSRDETQPHALCVLSYIRRSRIIIALLWETHRVISPHLFNSKQCQRLPTSNSAWKQLYIHIALAFIQHFLFLVCCLSCLTATAYIYTNSGVIPPQMEWQTTFDKCSLLSRSRENTNVSSKMSFLLCFFSLRFSSQHQRYILVSESSDIYKPSHTSCRCKNILQLKWCWANWAFLFRLTPSFINGAFSSISICRQ